MRRIKIYMEGGGNRKESKAYLRTGMTSFLRELKSSSEDKGISFQVIACGGREKTHDGYRNSLIKASEGTVSVLLVDAEDPVSGSPTEHLARRDGWNFAGIDKETVHLMSQVMETWIIADSDALKSYYGPRFLECLPKSDNLENTPKDDINRLLDRATDRTQKGSYHKTRHAPDLLARIDQAKVSRRCKACDNLFRFLQSRIAAV